MDDGEKKTIRDHGALTCKEAGGTAQVRTARGRQSIADTIPTIPPHQYGQRELLELHAPSDNCVTEASVVD